MQPVPTLRVTEATSQAVARDCTYFGVAAKAGAAGAVVNIWAGTSNAGALLDAFVLAANDAYTSKGIPIDGLRASGGVFIEVISGAFTGGLRFV